MLPCLTQQQSYSWGPLHQEFPGHIYTLVAVSSEDQCCFWANLQEVRGAVSAAASVLRNLMATET